MKLFDIFKKKKKMTIKELYPQILDEMWVCTFNFCPWEEEEHRVVIKETKIVRAEAYKRGIFVESSEPYPFVPSSMSNVMRGYIDKFTCDWGHWTAFFETKEEAEKAYSELMEKWKAVIDGALEKRQ